MQKVILFTLAVFSAVTAVPFALLPTPLQLVQQNADSTFCVHQTLLSCQNRFNTVLNITGNADWSDPWALNSQLANLYLQGVNGFLKVCNARHEFQQCLGNTYDACMAIPRFVNDGESPTNALIYKDIFRSIEFDCNGGFVQASQNYGCIMNVWNTQGDNFKNCFNTFNATITADPSKYCQASFAYEKCSRIPFQVMCNAETSWWQCERTRLGQGLNHLCPQNYCQVTTSIRAAQPPSARNKAVQRIFQGNTARNAVMRSMAEKKKKSQ